MKERLTLLLAVLCLWLFLFRFANCMRPFWALVFVLGFMTLYATYMQIAFKHQKRKKKKNPPVINEDYKPFVTVMIPAHNEQDVIETTANYVLAQDYPNFEIILIDDRSDDNTAQKIQELANKYEKVKILIRDKNAFPGKSAVLNDALKIAGGEAILVLDADAKIDNDFLKKLVPNLEPKDVGAVQARKIISNSDFNLLTRCQNNEYALDAHFQMGRDAVKGAVELRGNGELLKREALEDIGGWNNYTITDDLDMSTRMQIKGWDIRFCPDVKVYEEGVTQLVPLYRQRRRWIEGSIRRYLEHFGDVLTSKDMSLRVSLDMTAYITEFIMPILIVSEVLIQAFRYMKDFENSFWVSIVAGSSIIVTGYFVLIYALNRYNNLKWKDAIIQAFETITFITVIWGPEALFIIFKIIFTPKTMDWGKTQHLGSVVENKQN